MNNIMVCPHCEGDKFVDNPEWVEVMRKARRATDTGEGWCNRLVVNIMIKSDLKPINSTAICPSCNGVGAFEKGGKDE